MTGKYNPIDDMKDYRSWVEVARPKEFGFSDYIHALVTRGHINTDIIGAIAGFLWPSFKLIDGAIIISSEISKYNDLALKKMPLREVEYWCNFTNIDGMLPGVSLEFTRYLSEIMRDMWSAKLRNEFHGRSFSVEVIELDDQNELSITFFQSY